MTVKESQAAPVFVSKEHVSSSNRRIGSGNISQSRHTSKHVGRVMPNKTQSMNRPTSLISSTNRTAKKTVTFNTAKPPLPVFVSTSRFRNYLPSEQPAEAANVQIEFTGIDNLSGRAGASRKLPQLIEEALDALWSQLFPKDTPPTPGEQNAYDSFKTTAYRQHKIEINQSALEIDATKSLTDQKELIASLAVLADDLKLYEPKLGFLAVQLHLLHSNRGEQPFSESMKDYQSAAEAGDAARGPLLNDFIELIYQHGEALDNMIVPQRSGDYKDLYSVKMLTQYGLRSKNNDLYESIQHSYLRCAMGIALGKAKAQGGDVSLTEIQHWYDTFSKKQIAPPSPAMANAGLLEGTFSTCYTQGSQYANEMSEELSKTGNGGHGVSLNSESHILEAVKKVEASAKEASSFRKPVIAYYMSPDHMGFQDLLELKNPLKSEEETARDGHIAAWVPDRFMDAVAKDLDWYQFPAEQATQLGETYGKTYNDLYIKFETMAKEGNLPHTKMKARVVWDKLINCQRQSGEPYVLFKDNINRSSNEQHLGPIRLSNLCTEIVQYTDPNTSSICDVLTLSLPSLVKDDGTFDFEGLIELSESAQQIGDAIADDHHQAKSDKLDRGSKFRSLGIGAQGLATTLQLLKIPYDSREAIAFSQRVYEHILFGALTSSAASAKHAGAYSHFENSPAANGKLQFELGFDKQAPTSIAPKRWQNLKQNIQQYGLRNSLLTAQQPAVGWSRIFGNSQGAEPTLSNAFLNKDFLGEYWDINIHLVNALKERGLWSNSLADRILERNGSIQHIAEIPQDIRELFKTAYEVSADIHLAHSRARMPFVDQSESYNIFLREPDSSELTSHAFAAWKLGQKTGMYYLKMQPASAATKNMDLKEAAKTKLTSLGSRELDAQRLVSDMDDFTATMEALHWEKDDLNFEAVPARFNQLSDDKQHAIKHLLTFFAFGDEWVQQNIGENFKDKDWSDLPEHLKESLTKLYQAQDTQEVVHDEVYKELLQVTGQDINEVRAMLEGQMDHPVKQKAKFAEQYMSNGSDATIKVPRQERLLAFACLEGIMFSSSFAYLFHLKELDGKLAALIDSNDFIARDESLHKTIAIRLLNDPLIESVNPWRAREIVSEAVKIELSFVEYVLGEKGVSGMATEVMGEYVKFVSNGFCRELGILPLYPEITKNPLTFMKKQGMDAREDQMSKRSSLYYGNKMSTDYSLIQPTVEGRYFSSAVDLGVVKTTPPFIFVEGKHQEMRSNPSSFDITKLTQPTGLVCGIDGSCTG